MSNWQALADEAARWRDAGRTAELWWRVEVAFVVGSSLDRVVAIVLDSGLRLALAVVPAEATSALG